MDYYYNPIAETPQKYTALEKVLRLDDPRFWYYIPGFNGYEISNDGYLRSMKHHRKYPYGILITPIKTTDTDQIFELSDNNNKRQKVSRSYLMQLAIENQNAVSGYPRATMITDHFSRNDRKFIKKEKPTVQLDDTPKPARFTIIDS